MCDELPKGKRSWESPTYWGYDDEYGTNENGDQKYNTTDLTNKCTCGTHITYGTGPETEYIHADFCRLYKPRPK